MAFEIEQIGKNVEKTAKRAFDFLKSKPLLAVAGAAAVGGGIYLLSRGKREAEMVAVAGYPEPPAEAAYPAEPEMPGLLDERLRELLEDIGHLHEAHLTEMTELLTGFGEVQAAFGETLASMLAEAQAQAAARREDALRYEAAPDAVAEDIQAIMATESITFPEGVAYTAEQLRVMAKWAREEQKAIARGFAGTSKVILDGEGLIQRWLPSGEVQFIPKKKRGKARGWETRKVGGATYHVPKGTRKGWKPGEATDPAEFERQKKAWGEFEKLKAEHGAENVTFDPKTGQYRVKTAAEKQAHEAAKRRAKELERQYGMD